MKSRKTPKNIIPTQRLTYLQYSRKWVSITDNITLHDFEIDQWRRLLWAATLLCLLQVTPKYKLCARWCRCLDWLQTERERGCDHMASRQAKAGLCRPTHHSSLLSFMPPSTLTNSTHDNTNKGTIQHNYGWQRAAQKWQRRWVNENNRFDGIDQSVYIDHLHQNGPLWSNIGFQRPKKSLHGCHFLWTVLRIEISIQFHFHYKITHKSGAKVQGLFYLFCFFKTNK